MKPLYALWILPLGLATWALSHHFPVFMGAPEVSEEEVPLAQVQKLEAVVPVANILVPAKTIPQKMAVEVEAVMPATEAWTDLNTRVKHLSNEDERGLEALYTDAAQMIKNHERESDAYLAKAIPALVGGTLEQSFFDVSAWIRYSSIPTAALDHLWDYTPAADDPTADHHHAQNTEAFRYHAIQAYALSELRKRFTQDGINLSASEHETLVRSLVARVANEKSINQSLEIFQTLIVLGEKKAVLDALATRSERDRKLIAETMGIQIES
jgi:hypothetical protein